MDYIKIPLKFVFLIINYSNVLFQFLWNPYIYFLDLIESRAFEDSSIWSAYTTLICFSIVEWKQADRVKLQFQLQQGIPDPQKIMDKLHKIDMRGRTDTNWAEKHAKWIGYWRQRQSMVLEGQSIIGHVKHSKEYLARYQSNSIIFFYICNCQAERQ